MERSEPNLGSNDQYQKAIHLLRQIQVDYRHAKEQLQDVFQRFGEREAVAGKQLRTALDAVDHISGDLDGRVTAASGWVIGEWVLGREAIQSPTMVIQQEAPSMEIHCLGTFRVRVGLKRIEHWRSAKARSLFEYLVAQQGRPVPKDVLMEALWPGCDSSLANNNLKATVRALRQTLSSPHDADDDFTWVVYEGGNYHVNTKADLWSDAEQFEYHWKRGWDLEREGNTAEAVVEYKSAEALYEGDYLEEDLYEEWTLLRREALKDNYLALLSKLGDYCMEIGDCENAISYCQKIIARDCCREDAYRRLMICYSRLGNRNRALEWYRICEKTIKAELDLSPDHQTQALYRRLLNDEAL